MAYAQFNIPLGDPSFEDYVVPAVGMPMRQFVSAYRHRAWVDDLDNPPGIHRRQRR